MAILGILRQKPVLKFALLALLFGACGTSPLWAQEPKLVAASSDHSVFKSVWVAILNEAGLDVTLRPAQANVRRFWFVENSVQLDCCSIPEWRKRSAELETQIYTDPMFYSLQFFIHHEEATISYNAPEDLMNYRVAVITGHSHIHEDLFGARVEADSFSTLFRLIAEGHADIASVNEQEFIFQMGKTDWPIVRGPVFHRLPLRARVRKEHAELVPRLNAAIERLKISGQIDTLIGQAMRSEMYRNPD